MEVGRILRIYPGGDLKFGVRVLINPVTRLSPPEKGIKFAGLKSCYWRRTLCKFHFHFNLLHPKILENVSNSEGENVKYRLRHTCVTSGQAILGFQLFRERLSNKTVRDNV